MLHQSVWNMHTDARAKSNSCSREALSEGLITCICAEDMCFPPQREACTERVRSRQPHPAGISLSPRPCLSRRRLGGNCGCSFQIQARRRTERTLTGPGGPGRAVLDAGLQRGVVLNGWRWRRVRHAQDKPGAGKCFLTWNDTSPAHSECCACVWAWPGDGTGRGEREGCECWDGASAGQWGPSEIQPQPQAVGKTDA